MLTIALMAAGIGLSLLKGLDYEEALILGVMMLPLMAGRKNFDRDSKLLSAGISFDMLLPAAVVLASSAWLGYFSRSGTRNTRASASCSSRSPEMLPGF